MIITIDGPSGAGKEKIAKYLSKKYNFYHLDSGILYRRLSALIIKKGIKLNTDKNIKAFLSSIENLSPKRHASLRKEVIAKKASQIATNAQIRLFINKQHNV